MLKSTLAKVVKKVYMKSEVAVMTAPVPDTLYTPARMWYKSASMSVSAQFAMVSVVCRPCSLDSRDR